MDTCQLFSSSCPLAGKLIPRPSLLLAIRVGTKRQLLRSGSGNQSRVSRGSEEDYTRRKQNGPLIVALIETFDADPVATRQQLRELPRIRDSFISDLFAELIFLCDCLLAVSVEASGTDKAARFFFLRCAVSSDRTANGAV